MCLSSWLITMFLLNLLIIYVSLRPGTQEFFCSEVLLTKACIRFKMLSPQTLKSLNQTFSAYYSQTPIHKHLSMFSTLSTSVKSSSSSGHSKILACSNNAVWKPSAMSMSVYSVYVNLLHQRIGHPAIYTIFNILVM